MIFDRCSATPLRIRRFVGCRCQDRQEGPKSFSALALEGGVAPELAYVTAKFAALAPFARAAGLLAELLPVGGAVNAGTVRNRTRRVGERMARLRPAGTPDRHDPVTPAVVTASTAATCVPTSAPERTFEVVAARCSISMGRSTALPLLAMAIQRTSSPRRS
jgi:hypothetical protein